MQPTIETDYISVKFDEVIRGVKTVPRQKVLLQVSVHELHIDILKNICYWVFDGIR